MVAEVSSAGLTGTDGEIRPVRKGTFGVVPAEVATPLAVVLSELVQNAVEHGLRGAPGGLVVVAEREGRPAAGRGPRRRGRPARGVRPRRRRTGSGLQIVRTLVEGELGGSLVLERRPEGGTRAAIELTVDAPSQRSKTPGPCAGSTDARRS